jgi:hypothetical protein
VAVPTDTPVIDILLPVAALTLTTPVASLLQVPPAIELLSVADEPWHIAVVPVIGPGVGFTDTIVVVKQPDEGMT